MKKNRLGISLVALLALSAFTVWAIQNRDKPAAPEASVDFPTVDADEVTSVTITRANGDSVTLNKTDDTWRVSSPVDAKASQDTVNSAVEKLGELKVDSMVATKNENHARLEVDDAQAVKVVAKAGQETITDLKIGKAAGGNTMVRVGDSAEVFGVKGSIKYLFDRDLKVWRDRVITNIDESRIKKITFDSKSGAFTFVKDGDDWVRAPGQKAIKKYDPVKVKSLVSSAARLRALDFAKPDVTEQSAGLDKPNGTITLVVGPEPPKVDKDAGADAAAKQAQPTGPDETVVLNIGSKGPTDTDVYAKRQGMTELVLISKYLADRLRPDVAAFVKTEPKKTDAPPPPTPGQMPQMPAGHQDIPPEVMKQLQEQLKQRQQ